MQNSNIGFQLKDINLSAEWWIKKTDNLLMLKLGFQNLNDDKNFGAEFGLRNLIIHQKVYGGFSDGYYFDYFTYSGFIQAFIIKNIVSLNVDYKKIEKYKFFSLGLSFTFKR